jgi:hypothetical protein
VPRTRFDELVALAEEHDGLLTAKQARDAGIADSVLARLTQRGRLERAARGVNRIPHFPSNRFTQYREAVLWAKADDGPQNIALSHATALAVYGISDANPGLRPHHNSPECPAPQGAPEVGGDTSCRSPKCRRDAPGGVTPYHCWSNRG